MRFDFRKRSTIILSVGIKYSMCNLIYDVNYCEAVIWIIKCQVRNVSSPFLYELALATMESIRPTFMKEIHV